MGTLCYALVESDEDVEGFDLLKSSKKNTSHLITMSRNDWEQFTQRLIHPDQITLQNRNAFWAQIDQGLSIRQENGRTYVSSDAIDEDDILAAL